VLCIGHERNEVAGFRESRHVEAVSPVVLHVPGERDLSLRSIGRDYRDGKLESAVVQCFRRLSVETGQRVPVGHVDVLEVELPAVEAVLTRQLHHGFHCPQSALRVVHQGVEELLVEAWIHDQGHHVHACRAGHLHQFREHAPGDVAVRVYPEGLRGHDGDAASVLPKLLQAALAVTAHVHEDFRRRLSGRLLQGGRVRCRRIALWARPTRREGRHQEQDRDSSQSMSIGHVHRRSRRRSTAQYCPGAGARICR
jgi:hypothetical protein